MDLAKFRKTLESPHSIYLLVGEQEYLNNKVYRYCMDQVDEATRAFNWAVYDLETDPLSEVINTANTLPCMAQYRWVYVKQADLSQPRLLEYAASPSPRTVMILESSKKPKAWAKFSTIELPRRRDPLRWIINRAKKEGYQLENGAAEALLELVGEDYQQLENELEKQFLREIESRRISLESVRRMTRAVREYDLFALISTLAQKKTVAGLRILNRLSESGMNPPQILSMLYWNFRRVLVAKEMLDRGVRFDSILSELKIWSYRGREREIRNSSREMLTGVLIRLRETDRLYKTTSAVGRAHLERVIIDTCKDNRI